MKKLIYGLGAIAATVTPVVAVISCGKEESPKASEASKLLDQLRTAYGQDLVKVATYAYGQDLGENVAVLVNAAHSLNSNLASISETEKIWTQSDTSVSSLNDIPSYKSTKASVLAVLNKATTTDKFEIAFKDAVKALKAEDIKTLVALFDATKKGTCGLLAKASSTDEGKAQIKLVEEAILKLTDNAATAMSKLTEGNTTAKKF